MKYMLVHFKVELTSDLHYSVLVSSGVVFMWGSPHHRLNINYNKSDDRIILPLTFHSLVLIFKCKGVLRSGIFSQSVLGKYYLTYVLLFSPWPWQWLTDHLKRVYHSDKGCTFFPFSKMQNGYTALVPFISVNWHLRLTVLLRFRNFSLRVQINVLTNCDINLSYGQICHLLNVIREFRVTHAEKHSVSTHRHRAEYLCKCLLQ